MSPKAASKPRVLVGYLRVSTGRQGRSGLGLDAQRAALERFASSEGYEVVREFVDIETGSGADALERRPELAAALDEARRRRCAVVVARLDRLSRDVAFISSLMAHKIQFIVTELGADVDSFVLHIYAALAQRERERIAKNTKDALAAAKRRGVRLGGPKIDEARQLAIAKNKALADQYAAKVLPLIRDLQRAGFTSLHQIAEQLNARRVSTPRGGRWFAKSVSNVLARAARPPS
jgi:DNA invertase Pin-like site-specific DNA recombinase